MPNIVNGFFDVKKSSHYIPPLLKLSMMAWDGLNRWSSVDLALLIPD